MEVVERLGGLRIGFASGRVRLYFLNETVGGGAGRVGRNAHPCAVPLKYRVHVAFSLGFPVPLRKCKPLA